MNGLGNDFVVIDARRENARLGAAEVRALAARDHAITSGCDQVLILHPPRNSGSVFMQIFNSLSMVCIHRGLIVPMQVCMNYK